MLILSEIKKKKHLAQSCLADLYNIFLVGWLLVRNKIIFLFIFPTERILIWGLLSQNVFISRKPLSPSIVSTIH